MPIHDSLERYAGSLQALDEEFAEYARQRARQFAPKANWDKPDLPPGADPQSIAAWNKAHPNSFWGLHQWAGQCIGRQDWQAAKQPLEQLIQLCPDHTGTDSAYHLLARVHRALGETDRERQVLHQLASRSGDALEAYVRLMEIAAAAEDWPATLDSAQRILAVNPLQVAVHRQMAAAADKLNNRPLAIEAYRALLLMDPVDPAQAHWRLATLLHQQGDDASARRHVLQALEEAPRFVEAHRLLLELHAGSAETQAKP
jgi:tetratricopeptide (TPR) repeat protein